jgi:phosphoenolpyruvate carboxykinase (ATP)
MQQPSVSATQFVAALPAPKESDNVEYNPSFEQLRECSQYLETTTEFGSPSYVSHERSRNAEKTKNTIDHEFDHTDYELVGEMLSELTNRELVCLDRRMGRHPDNTYVCRYYVPKAYRRIALGWAKLFEPAEADREPDFYTVQLPDWDDVAVRVFPDVGFTAVLGSDYTGEAKKSFLRLYMYYAKRKGGLGLHAGSKRVELESDDGLETVGQLFLGLSGTGKSTLTAHGLWLDDPEDATMLQDDVCALLPDGTVVGSEGRGLFVKTHGLDSETEPAMYDAVTSESAVLENVDVDADGTVDFESDRYTANGRAIIQREELSSADAAINLPDVDQVFFITRNPAMPPVAKLTPEEAAVAFMLGESVQTSAGDPSAAGESIRVVGTNPFIIGSEVPKATGSATSLPTSM